MSQENVQIVEASFVAIARNGRTLLWMGSEARRLIRRGSLRRSSRIVCAAAVAALLVLGAPAVPDLGTRAAAAETPTEPYATRVLARDSLLSYWRLGETSGSTAVDAKSSRNGTYEGTITKGAVGALSGDPNRSALFTNGRVNVPALPSSVDFTVEGWMRIKQSSVKYNTLFGGTKTLRLMPRPNGYHAEVVLNGVVYKLVGNTPSNVGAWRHWALTRQGSTLTLYRNGVQVARATNLPASAPSALDADIGKSGTLYPAKGEIDEVAVYSAALSAADVQGDYRSESVPAEEPPPPPPPPSTTYVDRDSVGGACSDARTAAEAASAQTPWCSLERAAELAPSGSTVLVRGASYPEAQITGRSKLTSVTFKPFGTEQPVLDGLVLNASNGFRFQGLRITDQTLFDGVSRIELVGNDISPHGVDIRASRELVFTDNDIHDLTMEIDPATGRCVPPRCGYGFRIRDGVDFTFRGNLFSDIPADGIQSGDARNYLIEGNEFERISAFIDPNEHSDSIQFYRGSSNVQLRGNYFHDTRGPLLFPTFGTQGHTNLVIVNNLIVDQRDWGLKASDAPDMLLANNTVWDAGPMGVSIEDITDVPTATEGVRAFNNVINLLRTCQRETASVPAECSATPSFFALEDYNLIGADYRQGAHDLAGPPRFKDPDQLDYSLVGSSPGVDAGISTDAPPKDRLGVDRVDAAGVPNTGGGAQPYYDMGALEFNGTYEPPSGSYSQAILDTPGLLSYWRLGETSGTTAADIKGGRSGIYEGNVTLGAAGAINGDSNTSVTFSGGRVDVPALPNSIDFTVEGWMQLEPDATSNNTLFGAAGSLRLMPRPSGCYAGVWVNGVEYYLQGATASNLGQWVHWALVRQGSTLTLYRDGTRVAQRTDLPASTAATLAGDIGRTGSSYAAKGRIDEVAIYERALSESEVAARRSSAA
jgi:hypothetical protein